MILNYYIKGTDLVKHHPPWLCFDLLAHAVGLKRIALMSEASLEKNMFGDRNLHQLLTCASLPILELPCINWFLLSEPIQGISWNYKFGIRQRTSHQQQSHHKGSPHESPRTLHMPGIHNQSLTPLQATRKWHLISEELKNLCYKKTNVLESQTHMYPSGFLVTQL